jgi:signal transduction histidine kinase
MAESARSTGVNIETIQRAKQQWQAAVDAMPQLICLLDSAGRVIRANRTIERWGLGDVATLSGSSLHDLLHPGCKTADCYLSLFLDGAREKLASGVRAEREVLDSLLSRHLSIQVQPLLRLSEFDDSPCALVIVDDITAFKLLTRDLGQQLESESTQLRQSREDLRKLSASHVKALEDERKRIAAEMHDGIGQALSLIKLAIEDAVSRLSTGATAEVGAALHRLVPSVADAMQEVRRISKALRPPVLDDLGILAALHCHCRELAAVHPGLAVEKSFVIREGQVPAPLRLPIYRIVQEATHNAVRHANAKTLHIGLTRTDGELRLSIADDGCGFDPADARLHNGDAKGLGLLSMEERAVLSAGRYELSSERGRGTRIRVTWPLRPADSTVVAVCQSDRP